jgi:site-specific recombinase XerD
MTSLRQRMTEDMQVRNLALNTQMSYVQQVSLFARHFDKSPEQLGPEDIRAYQVYLTNEKKLAPGSVLIAVAALRFLYKVLESTEFPRISYPSIPPSARSAVSARYSARSTGQPGV